MYSVSSFCFEESSPKEQSIAVEQYLKVKKQEKIQKRPDRAPER